MMNSENMEELIQLIGFPESSIKARNLLNLENPEMICDSDISDWYFYQAEDGLELLFSTADNCLKKVSIILVPLTSGEECYADPLPYGIAELGSMSRIRAHWGDPVKHMPPAKIWGLAPTAGCDIYNIDAHPDKRLIIGYTPDLQIQSVHIELLEPTSQT